MDDVDTFSNDSSRLTLSGSRLFSVSRSSRSEGFVALKFETELGVIKSFPPSDDNETEWKDEMDDAGTWPEPFPLEGMVIPRLFNGGYE